MLNYTAADGHLRQTGWSHPSTGVRGPYPKYIESLFVVLAAYLVVPIIELPFLGLSVSAVMTLVLADRVLFRGSLYFGSAYRPYNWCFSLLALGILLSGTFAILTDRATATGSTIGMIVRFSYWMCVGFVAMRIMSVSDIEHRLMIWLQKGVIALSVVLGMAVFTNIELMTPNMFAIQFTMFSPFILPGLLNTGMARTRAVVWLGLIWGLSLMNGSRQGLFILALQFLLFFLLAGFHDRRRLRMIGLLPIMVAIIGSSLVGALALAPEAVLDRINHKLAVTESIERDKSWQFRLVKNQQARKVFASSPIVGVGVGGLRASEVPLDLPPVFRNANPRDFYTASSHNSHLQMLAETGLMGFVPWVGLLLVLLVGGLRLARQEIRDNRYFVPTALIGLVGMTIQFWVIAGHTNTAPFFLLGCLAGALVRAKARQRHGYMRGTTPAG